MALPVLLTVAGLGTGFLLLSRKRAQAANVPKVDGADTAIAAAVSNHVGDPTAAGAEGGNPVASAGTGEGVIIDPVRTNGADPSTSVMPGTLPAGQASDGQPEVDAVTSARTINADVFGNMRGVTNKQLSRTLSDIGPAAGLVW